MKAIFEIDTEKFYNKKMKSYGQFFTIDRLGGIWIVYAPDDKTQTKHFTMASDNDLKEWGIEKFEFSV